MTHTISRCIYFIIIIIFGPYIITKMINGSNIESKNEITQVNTGKDVIIQKDGKNILIDVEEYLSCILPGFVEPGQSDELIEAQAVAVRTRLYFAMGDNTIIDAGELGFMIYDDEAYINRWGKEQYKSIKSKYERAVINTQGKTLSK